MPSVIDGSASATFQTPLPVAQGGTGGTTSVGTGSAVMLSGQSGSAPVFGARAWCVFNGTTAGTNAPTAGGNVSTVTRNSAGNYTINFTTAMADTNYSVSWSPSANAGNSFGGYESATTARTTTSVTLLSINTSTAAAADCTLGSVVIYR